MRKIIFVLFIIAAIAFVIFISPFSGVILGKTEPPKMIETKIPEWQLEPNMLLWESRKGFDEPYPATHLTYELKVTNLSLSPAWNVHIYIRNGLFDWTEMNDIDKASDSDRLFPKQTSFLGWGHLWRSHQDPKWRPILEQTTELRMVWQDAAGWHQIQGHLPSQYSPNIFKATDLQSNNSVCLSNVLVQESP